MSRPAFSFYKSFDDTYQELNDKQKLLFMNTLLDIQFLRKKVQDVSFEDKILSLLWNSIKHSIKTSVKGYLDSQLKESVKIKFFGVYGGYDGKTDPFDTPSYGVIKPLIMGGTEQVEEEVEGEVEEEDTLSDSLFEEWWNKYNYKIGRKKTKDAWDKLSEEEMMLAIEKTDLYVSSTTLEDTPKGSGFIPRRANPLTWINGRRWEDEIKQPDLNDRVKVSKDKYCVDENGITGQYRFLDSKGRVYWESQVEQINKSYYVKKGERIWT